MSPSVVLPTPPAHGIDRLAALSRLKSFQSHRLQPQSLRARLHRRAPGRTARKKRARLGKELTHSYKADRGIVLVDGPALGVRVHPLSACEPRREEEANPKKWRGSLSGAPSPPPFLADTSYLDRLVQMSDDGQPVKKRRVTKAVGSLQLEDGTPQLTCVPSAISVGRSGSSARRHQQLKWMLRAWSVRRTEEHLGALVRPRGEDVPAASLDQHADHPLAVSRPSKKRGPTAGQAKNLTERVNGLERLLVGRVSSAQQVAAASWAGAGGWMLSAG